MDKFAVPVPSNRLYQKNNAIKTKNRPNIRELIDIFYFRAVKFNSIYITLVYLEGTIIIKSF